MIKILREYIVRTEEQKDIAIDRIYNDPKFRKYRDFIDYIIEYVDEQCRKQKSDDDKQATVWWIKFNNVCKNIDKVIKWAQPFFDDFCNSLGLSPEDEDIQNKVRKEASDVSWMIKNKLKYDLTLRTDLFYSGSDDNVDIDNNDWKEIQSIVRRINEYTNSFRFHWEDDEIELIKKYMTKTDKTLYRIERFDGGTPYLWYQYKLSNNITWNHDGKLKSFTEDLNCTSMKGMKKSRTKGDHKLIIYQTVGEVYSFNIDALSSYAEDLKSLEYEHLVSGEFEFIDSKEEYDSTFGDVIYVYIKQIHK